MNKPSQCVQTANKGPLPSSQPFKNSPNFQSPHRQVPPSPLPSSQKQRGTTHKKTFSFGGQTTSNSQRRSLIAQSATNTTEQRPNYDKLGWVFLKNEGRASCVKNPLRQRKQPIQKDLSASFSKMEEDASPESSVDRYNKPSSLVDFDEVIKKHMLREEQLNLQAEEDYAEDPDSPTKVLDKVTQQIHNQMCGAALIIGKTNLSSKGNESCDSKKTLMTGEADSVHHQATVNRRVPSITASKNGHHKSQTNQNSARGLGAQSNFQSFKKHAEKLPKVSLRTSLINQYTDQKISSQPISPKFLEAAKINQHPFHKFNDMRHSFTDSQNETSSTGGRKRGTSGSGILGNQTFALPQIERTTQQSTYVDNSHHSAEHTLNSQHLKGGFLREGGVNTRQFYENEGEVSNDQRNNTSDNQVTFSLTDARVEKQYRARFILNTIKKRGLEVPSPAAPLSLCPSKRNSPRSSHSIQDASAGPQKLPQKTLNISNQNVNNSSSFSSNSKVCSSCYQNAQNQKDSQSWDPHEEAKSAAENTSFQSDHQIYFEENVIQKSIKIKSREDNSFDKYNNKKNKSTLSVSLNDQEASGYSSIRDNSYFRKFHQQYTDNLSQAFEEVDKASGNDSFKKDVMGYMEQNSEVRRLKHQYELEHSYKIPVTMTPVANSPQIKKIHVKKLSTRQTLQESDIAEEPNQSLQGNAKLDRIKNYGRWYLKANEFQRIANQGNTPLHEEIQTEQIPTMKNQQAQLPKKQQYSTITHRRHASGL